MAVASSLVEDSITNTSEEFKEMFCESCKKHNEDVNADGFCVNCEEYLCSTCLKYHRRLMDTHVLQDKDSMPQDFCFEKCQTHQSEILKFYCQTCDSFLCSNCVKMSHKDCSDIRHMPTIVKDIEKKPEFLSISHQLTDIRQKVLLSNDETESDMNDVELLRNKCRSAVKKYREFLDCKLDVLETKMYSRIENIGLRDDPRIHNAKAKNASLKTDIDKLQNEIDFANGERCKLFMAMKRVQNEIQPIEKDVETLLKQNKVTYFVFDPEYKIGDLLDSVDGLGGLCITDSESKRTAKYMGDIAVNSQEDWQICGITGICPFTETLLVLVDFNNKSVKLFDKSSETIVSVLLTDPNPWDVTKINDKEVAVTLSSSKKIQFIQVRNSSLCKHKEICVDGDCRGIDTSDGNLVVSFIKPAQVLILDRDGNILHTFSEDTLHQKLFKIPLFLAVSQNLSKIYVTDSKEGAIITLSLKENDIAICKASGLQHPTGIATDRTGALYVIERDSGEINHYSNRIHKAGVLISNSQQMTKAYRCACDLKTNTLFVGLKEQNVIKEFLIEIQDTSGPEECISSISYV